ncbi:carbohydrate binding protein with CBM9 domain [Mongoliibacter ruber]|uniref:Carbohydrate binding protein with CBM9 domain n=1 Tax=Mongoliibacter ruber TaxID=1750599 RepID=A0A2T0WVM2_9BACT|nr:carbohydrate binding protein with CBM9 domain [Mongoliibacter ruber]
MGSKIIQFCIVKSKPSICFVFFCSLLSLFSSVISAQELEAYRMLPEESIVLDGIADEAFWDKVQVATGFRQQEPVPGNPASERTEVRIAYDDQNLYISAKFFDSEPEKIKAFQRRRDSPLDTDDKFVFILDTYNDQRSSFYFEINPLGLMGDGILRTGQGTSINRSWDGIWRAWVVQNPEGWAAEIRIPFMTLNFDPNNDTWGINFLRTIRRKNEDVLWTGFQRNQGINRPQDAGKLVGLHRLNQGVGVEAIPYAIASQVRQREGVNGEKTADYQYNMGGEINYNISPNLKAGITVNTDFAETEVDDRQINLTRFPLFFPERRAFFLEGSNIFLFAPSSGPNPYFSRRIGLQEGRPIPIRHGGRLIGRIKDTDVGFLQVRTGAEGERPGENFTVGRVVQNISDESTIGVVYTRRDTDGDSLPVRQTLGADLSLSTSKFLGNKNLQMEAFFVGHTETFIGDESSLWDRSVRGGRINFPNQPWDAHVSYREFGINYDPAVGFAPRVGFRRLQPSLTYNPLWKESSLIRELSWQYYFEYLMEMDWRPATVNHRVRILGLRFETGDIFQVRLDHNYEWLDRPFDILRDGEYVIQPGDYRNLGYVLTASSAPFRKIGGTLEYSRIGFWTGTQANVTANIFMRPFVGLNMTASWEHSQVRLAEGDFDTHIFRLVSGYDFSPWVSLNFNIQYDNITNFVGTNTRFSWVIDPGNTFFVVYNHNWQRFMERFISIEDRTNIKLAYTFRF